MLKHIGALAGASLALDAGLSHIDAAAAASNPISHVLVACQENRTFDEYFGYYPEAGRYSVPPGYYQPNGQGGKVYPYHFQSYSTMDVSHSWQAIHSE
jgi:phospholipase C